MEADTREIKRHRTAIKRYDLSKPVKQLLERGLLKKGDTFFDFDCGHGMDIEALQNLGYQASGWDPAFRPNAPKSRAAVVNLGFVLNVIEEPSDVGRRRSAMSSPSGRISTLWLSADGIFCILSFPKRPSPSPKPFQLEFQLLRSHWSAGGGKYSRKEQCIAASFSHPPTKDAIVTEDIR